MKWVNPGCGELFDVSNVGTAHNTNSQTGVFAVGDSYLDNITVQHNMPDNVQEAWVSFDVYSYESPQNTSSVYGFFGFVDDKDYSTPIPVIVFERTSTCVPRVAKLNGYSDIYKQLNTPNILYNPQKSFVFSPKNTVNVEIHVKLGTDGRLDMWVNHKLFLSYRSPSAFNTGTSLKYFKIYSPSYLKVGYSSFIIQDTRRIGYEKFVKLNIDPSTEQNMPQGSTTNYTLSGLSDSSEYSDITGVVAMLQATSRDANISTGTYNINGADVGTIDVSDSSGRAYELAHAETNSLTGLPFTRDDIEGKTLSFTVNGAS